MAKPNKETKEESKKELFSVFGEFDSYEEINQAAAGLKEEGDFESLKELAKENGIDEYDVEDYIDGVVDELTTPTTAALGRLKVDLEATDGPAKAMCEFYGKFTEVLIMENEKVTAGVMKKGVRIKGIYDALYKYAQSHKTGNCFSGSTTDLQDKELVVAFYTGTKLETLFDQWFK